MVRHLFRAATLVLAVAAVLLAPALPSVAGDYRHSSGRDFHHGQKFFRHSFARSHVVPPFTANRRFASNRHFFGDLPFAQNSRRSNPRYLRAIASPGGYAYGGGVAVVFADRQYAQSAGTYVGGSDVYQGTGGTYATGYSFGRPAEPAGYLRPTARVINVRTAANPCSYERGVCVIRP